MKQRLLMRLLLFAVITVIPSTSYSHSYVGQRSTMKRPFATDIKKAAFPFQNTSLSWEERVDDLLSRLTTEELILQVSRGGAHNNGPTPSIDRLGVGPHQWNTECLRGDVQAGNATSFPEAIGLAASFSTELLFEVARATGYEVRAKHNFNKEHNNYGDHTGISCFSPVINIMRHPLWGRNQETYGEDPFLTGELAKSFVQGLQGDHPRYILANAGCKHYAAYSGPDNTRYFFDAKVSERDLRMTFLPAFRECIKAGSFSIMCSYNSVNGVPACANKHLLTDILRDEWGFKGYVVSDEGALEIISRTHHYTSSQMESAIKSLKAGCNLDLASFAFDNAYNFLTDALHHGNITKDLLKERVKPLLYTRFRLGEFDPDEMNPYSKIKVEDEVESLQHRDLAVKAAVKSFVLLKNRRNSLPLDLKRIKKAAVVGPFANDTSFISGDYAADFLSKYATTVWQGLEQSVTDVKLAVGCADAWCKDVNISSVQNAVEDTDLVIVCLGTGVMVETEGFDRTRLGFPGQQNEVLKIASEHGHSNKQRTVILLLFNAGPLDVSGPLTDSGVDAIVECFYPSQSTGMAVMQMLTNAPGANPAGRLPSTWPADISQVPDMSNYNMSAGLTYRYFARESLLPFGYGLSYTEFKYSGLEVKRRVINMCDDQIVMVSVLNEGRLTGDEVIQVYMKWKNASVPVPNIQLVGFNRTEIQAKATITVSFVIEPRVRAVYTSAFVLEPGEFDVYVGGQQPNQKVKLSSNVLKEKFVVTGKSQLLKDCP